MTPSIEERREVAERLRRLDRTISSHSSTEEAVNEFLCALYGNATFSTIEMSPRNLCGAAVKLADLIDPERTCRNIGGNKWDFMCSECGGHTNGSPFHIPDAERDELARALGGRIASLHGMVPRYCPNCGAKVEVGK